MDAAASFLKRWVLFRVRSGELVQLLKWMTRRDVAIQAEHFPPDVRVVDAFYEREQDRCTLVLESEFYDPIPARFDGSEWSAPWNEIIFAFEPESALPVRPRPLPAEVRWEAYLLAPEQVVALLQLLAEGTEYTLTPFPPDATLMDVTFDPARRVFLLVLESTFFAPVATQFGIEGSRLALPERVLQFQVPKES